MDDEENGNLDDFVQELDEDEEGGFGDEIN
jgi:hypothetical protein